MKKKSTTHERLIVGGRQIMVEKSRIREQFPTKPTPGAFNVFSTGSDQPRRGRFTVSSKSDRTFDGIVFASKLEHDRYLELTRREKFGLIERGSIERQPSYRCDVNGRKVCTYTADFLYILAETGETVIEDTKSEAVQRMDYAGTIRRNLAEAIYGISIRLIARAGQ